MKRWVTLFITLAMVVALIGCTAPKQKEIDAINEFAASTGTELYSVKYDSASKIIEIIAPLEGINTVLSDYLSGDELAVESWNSMKAVMPEAENAILEYLSGLGYSDFISLSFADPLSPNVPLLTSQGGKIVYEATEVPVVTASTAIDSGASAMNDSLSNDPDEAVSVLEEFLAMNEHINRNYTIQFNSTSGNIEIFEVSDYMANTLQLEYMPEGVDKISSDQITMREGLISNWNTFNSILNDNGYSVPISLSISDSQEPEKILLTIENGEIVFDTVSLAYADYSANIEAAASSEAANVDGPLSGDPYGAVAVLEEHVKQLQNAYSTHTVHYNEATGNIEIFCVEIGLSGMLEKALAGTSEGADFWNSVRKAVFINCNSFVVTVRDAGYSVPISLSYSDSEEPEKPLITALDGVIVYDAVE